MPSASMVVAVVALMIALGGGAYAASVVGKNKVVTKSIKNGAVTGPKIAGGAIGTGQLDDGAVTGGKIAVGAVDGSKVADGSIGAADLAPGTIPATPGRTEGVTVVGSALADLPTGGSATAFRTPSGYAPAGATIGVLAPIEMTVANLEVAQFGSMGAGQSRTYAIVNEANAPVISCTIPAGGSVCSSTGTGTFAEREPYGIGVFNSPTGASGTTARVGYTIEAG